MSPSTARLFKQYLDRNLARLRHDHDTEIAKLRAEIAGLANRSPDREYEALTIAWEHFSDAVYATRAYMLPVHLPRDLSRLDDEEVKEFMDAAELTAFDITFVIKSANRNAACIRVMMVKKINAAEQAIWQARRAIRRQSVYIPLDLNDQFEAAITVLEEIQLKSRAEYHATGALQGDTNAKLIGVEGESRFGELRAAVRCRLLQDSGSPVRSRVGVGGEHASG